MSQELPLFVRLLGQMPSGKNQIKIAIVRGRMMRYPEPRFRAWRVKAYNELQTQRSGWQTLRKPATVTVRYWPGDLIRRDVDGMMSALCHLLEFCPYHPRKHELCNVPIMADDSLLTIWHWSTMPLDRENPRIEFTIEPLQEEDK